MGTAYMCDAGRAGLGTDADDEAASDVMVSASVSLCCPALARVVGFPTVTGLLLGLCVDASAQ